MNSFPKEPGHPAGFIRERGAASRPRLWAGLCLLAILLPAGAANQGIRETKHNLALSGAVKGAGVGETELCQFCHTPHGGETEKALWNHSISTATYIPYSSTTMKASVGQPTGDSKLCLSCHDGTVALGMLRRAKPGAAARMATTRMAPGRAVLGTDLSDDHPVSFTYDSTVAANAQLKDPATLHDKVLLDARRQVQCTSCHDPHNNQYGMFLVQNNYASALCLNCHDPKLWTGSAHRNSGRTWNGMGRKPWPHSSQSTVAGNGCENCHAPHNAGTHQRLLNYPQAEDNCLVCHNGSVALKDISVELNKPSVHPVLTTSVLHDEAEEPANSKKRHATCVDCHNPHAANANPGVRPNASGALAGVMGINTSGMLVKSVTREYELCFRCHADSGGKGTTGIIRQWPEPNLRLQFLPGNVSYHPVEAMGKNPKVPSLVAPWTTASFIYCTDCHNNNQGPGAGGAGANGPHGSLYPPLLERNMARQDYQAEGPDTYALCYKCHSESILMADSLHSRHVRNQQAACSTCHAAHGVSRQSHLINFNNLYVKPLNGLETYLDKGAGVVSCTLICHGKSHNNISYTAR
jgi:predicted CXXCH cytochrome family protein